jgi:hypothetical protein
MPHKPKDGIPLLKTKALWPSYHIIPTRQLSIPPSGPYDPSAADLSKRYANWGFICAVASLFIVPEIFGSIAIILGAYAWKLEPGDTKHGRDILILGIVCMFVGLYSTSFFALYDLIPY